MKEKEEQAYEEEGEEEEGRRGEGNRHKMREMKMWNEWAAVYVIEKSKNRYYIHAVCAISARIAFIWLFRFYFYCCWWCCCSWCSHLISFLLLLLFLVFWFDFVECEIIIKFVGVYFVCSELYNLHELLGKRFACTHTHTQTSHNRCLSEILVSSPMTYVKRVNVSPDFMCG